MAKNQINVPSKGMNKDSWALNEADYVHLQNGNFDSFDGGTFSLTNEMSNILSSKFKVGFKVIGLVNDLNTNNTYFFLVNPSTNVGEFGFIESNQNNSDLEDLVVDCDTCYEIRELSEPLENLTQTELQTYQTLISDSNCDTGFNFNINNPIKSPVIKDEKCGKTVYFTDNLNPPRYINIDRLGDYFIDNIPCEDDEQRVCADFTKMEIFKQFSIPTLNPVSIELGGRLKMGVYQFLIAYSDALGNEISEYYSITNPISIFDRDNIILEQPELADRTNFSIKLEVGNLDSNYTHYKIAVIQTADLDAVNRFYIEGIHTIDDNIVVYGGEQNKEETSIFNLSQYKPKVERTEGITSSNNILFQYGITNKKEINLQPVVNLLGQFAVKWQTSIATEDFYVNGIANLYKGYNRDEIVPLGIKFGLEGGFETAVFPFIGRQPENEDLEVLVNSEGEAIGNNKDVASILANKGDCNTTDRTKRWQFYNTAEEDELSSSCIAEDVETVEVIQEFNRYCIVEDVATIPAGTTSIFIDTEFTNLTDYINDNVFSTQIECEEAYTNDVICEYLYADYSAVECTTNPFEGLDCDEAEVVSEVIEVKEVEGEIVTKIEKIFGAEYLKMTPPSYCDPYLLEDGSSNPDRDEALQTIMQEGFFDDPVVYIRDSDFYNESCAYANDILIVQDAINNTATANFNNYYYSDTVADLYSTKISTTTNSNFNIKVHKNGIWFIGDTLDREKFILDISKQKIPSKKDSFSSSNQTARVSIFKSCSNTTAIYSEIINLDLGAMWLFEKNGTDLKIIKENGDVVDIASGWFSSKRYYVVLDTAIIEDNTFINVPSNGCYTVTTRDIEYSRVDVSWESILLNKKIELKSNCTFQEPVVQACRAIPYRRGKFAYWESSQTYPDNNELFNSASLTISPEDIPSEIKSEFERLFVNITIDGKYIWKKDAEEKEILNFTCRNIRHFKFPDNSVAPFIYEGVKLGFAESVIFPLGINLNEDIVNSFLDIAKNNGLITEEDRNKITSYEVVRGDLTSNRSVVASGLLYDLRKYQEKKNGKYLLYPNYPFNSYSDDKFNNTFDGENRDNLGEGATWGNSNRNYTFHSPETDYAKPTIASEMSVQAYMYGQSKTFFDEVEQHPKWVILTDKARNLANTLALLEVTAEVAIQAAQAFANFNPIAGVANTVFPGGIVASGIILAFKAASGAVFSYGKYRYEWLKIFKDLGSPYNFAYYSFAEGRYNYIENNQTEGNLLRGLNVGKYLTDGRFENTNEITAEKLDINNIYRERSVFLSIGKYPIVYPTTYKNYDKDSFTSSLTYAGENGLSETGRSSEVLKNIASPYVALKNYLPEQHGTINSVRWITTGYRGDLLNPSTCNSIFGGDTFISRHTLKRKHSQFLSTSMGQADLTPFNYYFYNNIGRNPEFWVSYDVDKDFNSNGKLFPDITTDKSFDSEAKGGNYFRPPSKFYLYHYGIPSFLCETRINTNFRYAGKELSEHFYPQVGDIGEWTQEKNVPIKTPNSFKYNSVYSKPVESFKNRKLSVDYNRERDECRADFPNGTIYSLPDNSENNLFDPWLIYRPLDFYEFPANYGKLKELKGIENAQVLARFANTVAIFNAVDTIIDDGKRPEAQYLGDGGVFARRPVTFSETELGYGGTQTSHSLSCEFGHFHVDAKRGQVIEIQNGGKGIQEISAFAGDKPSGMRNWFKEHLPFKILKSGITGYENIDVDNAYNGIGITMGWDSRFRRVFITKKDYIPKKDKCISYDVNLGFVTNATECNQTPETVTCPTGYTFNVETQMCEKSTVSLPVCPSGYTYDLETQSCIFTEVIDAECICLADVFATPETICSGESTSISLTSTETGISYSWTVTQSGVTGATTGTGSIISQTLNGAGTATYTITPFEIESNCLGTPIEIEVIVNAIPNVIATPNSLTISDGDTAIINLTSDVVGATFVWTVVNSGTSGAVSGSGNTISQIITGEGTTTYTITPTANGCEGTPIDVIVTVETIYVPCNQGMDVVFLVDYTGSMGSSINAVKTSIADITDTIEIESAGDYRLSLVLFDETLASASPTYVASSDYTTLPSGQKYVNTNVTADRKQYITAMEVFSSVNKVSFTTQLNKINTGGFPLGSGQNTPEPGDLALNQVVNFDMVGAFRNDSAKIVIYITDAVTGGDDDVYDATDISNVNQLITDCNNNSIRVLLMKSSTANLGILENLANETNGLISPSFAPAAIISAIENICN